METLFAKMKEYVHMETEISAEEFLAYYKSVMDALQADFEQLTEEALLQGKIITGILTANAGKRQKYKDGNAKKYKKIQEKSSFWNKAIDYRLKKSGLAEAEIESRAAAMEKEM